MLHLLYQYLHYSEIKNGVYRTPWLGIPLSCPLSPLMGALYLKQLDSAIEKLDVFYIRYMDDWVILAKTRNRCNESETRRFATKKHPDKTEIGRINNGFTFLGYRLSRGPIKLAYKTMTNAMAKASRLYEQGASLQRIGDYWTRF